MKDDPLFGEGVRFESEPPLDGVYLRASDVANAGPLPPGALWPKFALATPVRPRRRFFQFRLSSLLLTTVYVAALCSAFAVHPGLGILFSVLTIPGFIYTVVVTLRDGAAGASMPASTQMTVFVLCTTAMSVGCIAGASATSVVLVAIAIVNRGFTNSRFAIFAALFIPLMLAVWARVTTALWPRR